MKTTTILLLFFLSATTLLVALPMDNVGVDMSNDSLLRPGADAHASDARRSDAGATANTTAKQMIQSTRGSESSIGEEQSESAPNPENDDQAPVERASDRNSITSGATDGEIRSDSPFTEQELLNIKAKQSRLADFYNKNADSASGFKKQNLEEAASSSQASAKQYQRAVEYLRKASDLSVVGSFNDAELLNKASEQAQTAAKCYEAVAEAHLSQRLEQLYRFKGAASNSQDSAMQYESAVEYSNQISKLSGFENSKSVELLNKSLEQAQAAATHYAAAAEACLARRLQEREYFYQAALNSQASAKQYEKTAEYLKQSFESSSLGNSNDAECLNKAAEHAQTAAINYALAAEAYLPEQWKMRHQFEEIASNSRFSAEQYVSTVEYSQKAAEASSSGASASAVFFEKASKAALTNMDKALKHARQAEELQTSELSIFSIEKKENPVADPVFAEQTTKVKFLDEASSDLRHGVLEQDHMSREELNQRQQEAIEASTAAEAVQSDVVKLIETSNPENHQAELLLWDEVIEKAIAAETTWARVAAVCQEKVAALSSQLQEELNTHLQDANDMVRTWHAKTISREANKAARIACQAQQKAAAAPDIKQKMFLWKGAIQKAAIAKESYVRSIDAFQQGHTMAPEDLKEWWIKNFEIAKDNKVTWNANESLYKAEERTAAASSTYKIAANALRRGLAGAETLWEGAVERSKEAKKYWEQTIEALQQGHDDAIERLKSDWQTSLAAAKENYTFWGELINKDKIEEKKAGPDFLKRIGGKLVKTVENATDMIAAAIQQYQTLPVVSEWQTPSPVGGLSQKELERYPDAVVISHDEINGAEPNQKIRVKILKVPVASSEKESSINRSAPLSEPNETSELDDLFPKIESSNLKKSSAASFIRIEEVVDSSNRVVGRSSMVADQLLVRPSERVDLETFLEKMKPEVVSLTETMLLDRPLYVLRLSKKTVNSISETQEKIERLGLADSSQPNFLYGVCMTPLNDTSGVDDSLLQNFNGVEPQGPITAVLDTGVNFDVISPQQEPGVVERLRNFFFERQDLAIRNRRWQNPKHNPLKGDIYGIYCRLDNSDEFDDGQIQDDFGHGDTVSKVIVDILDKYNADGQIMACKISEDRTINSLRIVRGIEYAYKKGAKILNLSLSSQDPINGSTQYDQSLVEAFNNASNYGAIIVHSAGNNGINLNNNDSYVKRYQRIQRRLKSDQQVREQFGDVSKIDDESFLTYRNQKAQASESISENEGELLPNVIFVAASNGRGLLVSISNYGNETIDLAALGQIGSKVGTSIAAPHISAALDVLIDKNPLFFEYENGNFNYKRLITYLYNTADNTVSWISRLSTLKKVSEATKHGELNLDKALAGLEKS